MTRRPFTHLPRTSHDLRGRLSGPAQTLSQPMEDSGAWPTVPSNGALPRQRGSRLSDGVIVVTGSTDIVLSDYGVEAPTAPMVVSVGQVYGAGSPPGIGDGDVVLPCPSGITVRWA